MKKMALALAAISAVALGGAAFAQDACVRPAAPSVADGATATVDQLMASKTAVAAFIADSDKYQSCLVDGVTAQRAAAKAAKTKFDESIAKGVTGKIKENQADKEATGKSFNAAVKAYKAAHPT